MRKFNNKELFQQQDRLKIYNKIRGSNFSDFARPSNTNPRLIYEYLPTRSLYPILYRRRRCIEYITAITCQFNKLKLQITDTKFIAGVIAYLVLKEIKIPSTYQGGASAAEYLATVISLMRMIIRNFEIIKLMTDVAKEDNLTFPSSSLAPDTCYRDDSPYYSQSSSSSSLYSE